MLLKKDFISLGDLQIDEIWHLLHMMRKIKCEREKIRSSDNGYSPFYANALKGVISYSLFNYPSIRTISSYVVALNEMGASPNQHFDIEDIPRTYSNEKVSHIAKVLGGSKIPWFNLAYVRFVGQKSELFIRELAEHSKIPVINAMTKKYHPLQGITDIFTLLEEWKYFEGTPIHGKQITYFGLGNNNVTHSAMLAASAIGINFLLICPQKKNYLPAEDVLEKALAFSKKSGSQITINDSAKIADTDAVFTDTHAMGDTTAEKIHTKKILAPYVVDNEKTRLFKNPNWIFLHCMPIHVKPDNTDYEEVSQSIADGPHSRIFQEAENRLYAIMALLYCFTQRGFFAI